MAKKESGRPIESGTTSRRGFIGAVSGAAGALYAGAFALPGAANAAMSRSCTAGRDFLYVEGALVGPLMGRDGGTPFVETRVVSTPGEAFPTTVLGTPKVEPLLLEFGSGMAGSLYEWVMDALNPKTMLNRKSGFVAFTNYEGMETGRLTFHQALLSEVTTPALDTAATRAPVAFAIKLDPEITQLQLAPSGSVKHTLPLGAKSNAWNTSGFSLAIDGIDTTKVLAVNPHTTALKVAASSTGEFRVETRQPVGVDVGKLELIVRMDGARQYLDWFNQLWGPQGDPGQQFLRTAAIDFVTRDPTTGAVIKTFGKAIFHQAGVSKVSQMPLESGSGVAKVKVELYASAVTFDLKGFA